MLQGPGGCLGLQDPLALLNPHSQAVSSSADRRRAVGAMVWFFM